MGWQERDYSDQTYRERLSAAWAVARPPRVTLALMILHGVGFVTMLVLSAREGGGPALALVAPVDTVGVVAHGVATTSLFTALFVVLALWSLGGRLEPLLGGPRLVGYYLLGTVAGGAAYYGTARAVALLATGPLDYPVGVLAGLCLLVARAFQHERVHVLGWATSAGRLYALLAAIVVGLEVIRYGLGGTAWLAAAVAGVAAIWLAEGVGRRPNRAGHRGRRLVRPSIPDDDAPHPLFETPDIDDLLAKISRSGLGSLTPAERQRLEDARRALRRRIE